MFSGLGLMVVIVSSVGFQLSIWVKTLESDIHAANKDLYNLRKSKKIVYLISEKLFFKCMFKSENPYINKSTVRQRPAITW